MTSGTSVSFTRDPATDMSSSFILRSVVLCIETFFLLNGYSSVRLGRASFTDRSRNCIQHLHKADLKNYVLIVMLILCLQRVIKMARNLFQSVLWPLVLRVCDKETS